jgi:hypothetical protein
MVLCCGERRDLMSGGAGFRASGPANREPFGMAISALALPTVAILTMHAPRSSSDCICMR